MKIDFDDPKWTAYVLGELSPDERQAAEMELEASEELKAFVEELQIAAFAMKDAMTAEAASGLTFQQRNAVRSAAGQPAPNRWFGPAARWAVGLAAAAGVVAMIAPSLWRSRPVDSVLVAREYEPAPVADSRSATPAVAGPAERERASTLQDKVVAGSATPSGSAAAAEKAAAKKADSVNPGAPPDVDVAGRAERAQAQMLRGLSKEAITATAANELRDALSNDRRSEAPSREAAAGGGGGGKSEALRAPGAPAIIPSLAPGLGGGPVGGGAGGARGGGGGGGGRGGRGAQAASAGAGQAGGIGQGQGFGSGPAAGGGAPTLTPPAPAPPPVALARAAQSFSVPPAVIGTVVPNPADTLANRLDGPVESYDLIGENPFIFVNTQQVATFSSDVDTASYANIRRFINAGQLPPRAAVRIEEMVNYFTYDYPKGAGAQPVTANIEAAAAPWNPEHRLVRVGIKAKDAQIGEKPSNLVFLIDVSGSMEPAERLPLLKSGLRMLVDRLTENDRVTIVTYAGQSGVALPPTNGTRKDVILRAIDGLRAEGSTNGGAGIQTAYDLASANFIRGGVNRVVLMTDGDFNVGVTSQNELVRLIEDKARTGVFLSVLGVGTGNVKDSTMEQLADHGNGNYAYIDSLNEARKILVDQMGGTLITVAKDVKLQVEFNPAQVTAYRLVGYENRVLTSSDFNNDRKDAGDMGAGHTVTALFEVVPVGVEVNNFPGAGALRYQPATRPDAPVVNAAVAKEMLNLRIRYKEPEGGESKLIDFPLVDRGQSFAAASVDFRFAAAVAEFGMLLRDSPHRGASTWASSIAIARESRGADREGYRDEFVRLVEQCERIARVAR